MDKKGVYNFPLVDVQLKSGENYAALGLTMQYNLCEFRLWGYVQGKVKRPIDEIASLFISTDESATP